MAVVIDYDVGAMGNSILAHILYATNQINLTPETFFNSETGDAHTGREMREQQDNFAICHIGSDQYCNIKVDRSTEIIRIDANGGYYFQIWAMGYNKFYSELPIKSTLRNFNMAECAGRIEEYMATFYFEYVYHPSGNYTYLYDIKDYFNNNITLLKHLAESHGFKWDNARSDTFYNAMIKANKKYIDRRVQLEQFVDDTINGCSNRLKLEVWEKGITIAEMGKRLHFHPKQLKWNHYDFFSKQGNDEIIVALKLLREND